MFDPVAISAFVVTILFGLGFYLGFQEFKKNTE